jgi:hypothetical protein
LPSKEGIERSFDLDAGSISVVLEVDVRKQRKENIAAENA